MRYPVLLFDLFRTILLFTPQAPTGQVKEPTWRAAMGGLRGRAAPLLGGIEFDFFLDALYDVSVAIAKARAPEHLEVPIEERYARALARLGCEGAAAADTAARARPPAARRASRQHRAPGGARRPAARSGAHAPAGRGVELRPQRHRARAARPSRARPDLHRPRSFRSISAAASRTQRSFKKRCAGSTPRRTARCSSATAWATTWAAPGRPASTAPGSTGAVRRCRAPDTAADVRTLPTLVALRGVLED